MHQICCSCFPWVTLPWGQINRSHVLQKKENISIFICGINMCRVASTYCTIHRVNCTSFSRQKGQTVLVNMPLVFIHRQIALYIYICIRIHVHAYVYICIYIKTAQYKTASQQVSGAVTRCKMHGQKNP